MPETTPPPHSLTSLAETAARLTREELAHPNRPRLLERLRVEFDAAVAARAPVDLLVHRVETMLELITMPDTSLALAAGLSCPSPVPGKRLLVSALTEFTAQPDFTRELTPALWRGLRSLIEADYERAHETGTPIGD